MPEKLNTARERLENTKVRIKIAKAEMAKPFAQEEELQTYRDRALR